MNEQTKIFFGINTQNKWGFFAILNKDGGVERELIAINPTLAQDHNFVVSVQNLLFIKLQEFGLNAENVIEEVNKPS